MHENILCWWQETLLGFISGEVNQIYLLICTNDKTEKQTPVEDARSQARLSPLWFFALETNLTRPKKKLVLTALGQHHPKLPGSPSFLLGERLPCPVCPHIMWNAPVDLALPHILPPFLSGIFQLFCLAQITLLNVMVHMHHYPALQDCFWGLEQMSHHPPSEQSRSPCAGSRTGDSMSLLPQQCKNNTSSDWLSWEAGATRSLQGRTVFTLTSWCHLKTNVILTFNTEDTACQNTPLYTAVSEAWCARL